MGSSQSSHSTAEEDVANSKRLEAPPDFKGASDRKCTDVLFTVVIVAMWVAMTIIGITSIRDGDPEILINGVDYAGRICGKDSGVADKPKFYYTQFDGTGVCVESCPSATDFNSLWGCADNYTQYTAAESYDCGASTANANQCLSLSGLASASASGFADASGDGVCMYQIESTDFLNHCIYTDSTIVDQFVSASDDVKYIQQFLVDIYTARNWILGFGICFSFVLGFLYCLLLRLPGLVTLIVWTSIAIVTGIFVGLGYAGTWLSDKWDNDGSHSNLQVKSAYWIGIILYVCAALWVCLVLFLRKRITLATGVVKESARAIGAIPLMMLMPVVQVAGLAAFLVPWVVYAAYTASIATVTTSEGTALGVSYTTKNYEYSNQIVYRGWFLLFCFFWSTQFISAMGQIIIALTIVKYYFSRDKSTVNSFTFFSSLGQGMFYHSGTAAFGSLIIAVIEMIRAVIAYFQKKARMTRNKVAEYMLCVCACCFWCLEKCMKFINKNAYIQTAIFSTSFCRSAKNAFWLIARNIARVGALTLVSELIIIIMKLVICLATMGVSYLCMQKLLSNDLYSVVGPTIFVGLISYMIAEVFADLFSMTCLTILQCFIADEEMFSAANRYADNDLRDWVSANGGGKASGPNGSDTPRRRQHNNSVTGGGTKANSPNGIAAVTGTG